MGRDGQSALRYVSRVAAPGSKGEGVQRADRPAGSLDLDYGRAVAADQAKFQSIRHFNDRQT